MNPPAISLRDVSKTFTLHLRGGARLQALTNVSFDVRPGECVVLGGPSGAGKSSILKMIYGNYRCEAGDIVVSDGRAHVAVNDASERQVLALRRSLMAYVSQFLRVIPRVPTLDLVAEPIVTGGSSPTEARTKAKELLAQLRLPERLWALPPATFSGGEQQRVNIARGLAYERPILLLDEPTASLDAENKEAVLDMIRERKSRGAAILGIFHDAEAREALADRVVEIAPAEMGASEGTR